MIPDEYLNISEDQLRERISGIKKKMGRRLVILGHHYQRDEVIDFADYRGDSLGLSQKAAEQKQAEFIVFCGVHFMAEAADIISSKQQTVHLPKLCRSGIGNNCLGRNPYDYPVWLNSSDNIY